MKDSSYITSESGANIRCLKGTMENSKALLFFPFVGGQSLSFKKVAESMDDTVSVWGIDLPGHGWSTGKLIDSFDTLIELLFPVMSNFADKELYLFGHSLGGLIAFRLTQLMEKENFTIKMVFISASPLPHRVNEWTYLKDFKGLALIEDLAQHGGVPEGLTSNEGLIDFYSKILAADIGVFLSASITRQPTLKTKTYVMYSKGDSFLDCNNIFEWDIYGRDISFVEVRGNHLYVATEGEMIGKKLIELIQAG